MERLDRLLKRVDSFQRDRTWSAFVVAVFRKFGDDRAGHLAATIAFYAFSSMFPLLLVLVTVLGIVLEGNPELQERILESTLASFPIIGDQIQGNLQALTGSTARLLVGLLVAMWAGLGVLRASQDAMNAVWDVPMKAQPGFFPKLLRALIMLAVLGAFVVAATILASFGALAADLGMVTRVLSLMGSAALNVMLFASAYKFLTATPLRVRDVLPGAAFAGLLLFGLQTLGSFLVSERLQRAEALYGFFGVVLGLLAYMYLAAQITVLGAEVNVVLRRRLWPRSLRKEEPEPADLTTLEAKAKVEERIPSEHVEVDFDEPPS